MASSWFLFFSYHNDARSNKQKSHRLSLLNLYRWPRGLWRGSEAAGLLELCVRIPPRVRMSVSCEYYKFFFYLCHRHNWLYHIILQVATCFDQIQSHPQGHKNTWNQTNKHIITAHTAHFVNIFLPSPNQHLIHPLSHTKLYCFTNISTRLGARWRHPQGALS